MTPNVDVIIERIRGRAGQPVLWDQGAELSGAELLRRAGDAGHRLRQAGLPPGAIVGFLGDYSATTVSLFLALFSLGAIAVPFSPGVAGELAGLQAILGEHHWLDLATMELTARPGRGEPHHLVRELRAVGEPGLIVFTSGSTGKPKAILHSVERVASKFLGLRKGWRTLQFLMIDHFGGFNTLLASLAYGGVGICSAGRSPDTTCQTIEASRAELFPTTPTFLAMLIASGVWRHHDLSSVELVTYGAEPMPETTLKRLPELFPRASFKQTYGLSELGVLRSASPDRDSLWLSVGGDGFEVRVVDGILHVRSQSNMLGYLNADSPIGADGWMNTGDLVEERDGLLRIVGRQSEVINVGGQKVHPTEVEDILLTADNVAEATVYALPHPLLGQVVAARVTLTRPEEHATATTRLRTVCRGRLQKYKQPMRFDFVEIHQHGTSRSKKKRC